MTTIKRWIEFYDAKDDWTWLVDASFMMSGWECIFGKGCPGTTGNTPDVGCCDIGVLTPASERRELLKRAVELTNEDWQNRQITLEQGGVEAAWHKREDMNGRWNTQVVTRNGVQACVFANRSNHPGGAGCAFHSHALRIGERPMDWKPEACWMMPITLDHIDARRMTVLRQAGEEDWFGERDAGTWEWWCANETEAWHAVIPVFMRHDAELQEIVGESFWTEEVFPQLDELWRSLPPMDTVMPEPVPITLSKR